MDWIKRNKLATVLIIIVLLFLWGSYSDKLLSPRFISPPAPGLSVTSPEMGIATPKIGGIGGGGIFRGDYPPVSQTDRLVVEESSMSLVTPKVQETADKIVEKAKSVGGFMVSTSLSQPEEAPFATVVIRVPSEKMREVLEFNRSLATKVSSENIMGTDVTSEYVDLQARLETLEKTKSKFEDILEKAITVQDTLTVQRELISLQDQIDAYKGRQKYLEQTAKLAKITVYLSSDEIALPYTPNETFRPEVIFKMAVRSLVGTLRGGASLLIWIIVYSVIWVPVVILITLIRKRSKKNPQK